MKKKTIIITCSPFGNPVSDYYNYLAGEFLKFNYKVIFVFDGLRKEKEEKKFIFFWPNNRPTKFSDFWFFYKLVKKEKPELCISNFGSTNVVSIVSYFLGVRNRMNYVHTTSTQLDLDSNKNNIKAFILKKRKQFIYNLNTQLLTNSEGTKKDTVEFYNVEKNKIKVIPLLIKESIVNYKKKSEREYSICIVGRLHSSKGHKELFYLFKKSIIKFPKLKLKIIGDGYLKDDLIELSKKLNISKNIDFLGNVPNSKIGVFFSQSLINISSSIEEAYGLVNIEALREGTPLICTRTAGALDILSDKINGVYFSHDDEDSLSNALEIVLSNWDFYSCNAINTFKNNYSIEKIEEQQKRITKFFL
jgi:glycosyltransferase involved in cell wall biosynthesis